jgi:hypothetical protein
MHELSMTSDEFPMSVQSLQSMESLYFPPFLASDMVCYCPYHIFGVSDAPFTAVIRANHNEWKQASLTHAETHGLISICAMLFKLHRRHIGIGQYCLL